MGHLSNLWWILKTPLVSFLDDLLGLPLRRQNSPRWASYSSMSFRYDLELNPDVAGIIAVGSWGTAGRSLYKFIRLQS